ncbi:MAG: RNA polymerase sigma factor [Pseudomonadota bacterium]
MTWLRDIDRWFAEEVFVHQGTHRAYARRLMRDADDAEDLVQEAYARLFALENWAGIGNPHAFTMRIIHNGAIERFRRADVVRLDRSVALQTLDPVDDSPAPDVIAADRAELRRLARAMETLPERCREAVQLRRIEGLPPGEVAERMRISVSTVEKHLTKGLRLLVERLATADDPGQARRAHEWIPGRRRRMR